MANRNLKDILKPNYGDGVGESGTAPVTKDNGSTLDFFDSNRRLKDNTRINIGTSANSNTGDPIRTAFIKVGNFMEASYMADSDKDRRLLRMEKPFGDSDFRLLGIQSPDQIRFDSDAVHSKIGVIGIDSDSFASLKPGDTIILSERIAPTSRSDFTAKFSRAIPHGRIDINTVALKNGEYGVNAPAYLRMGSDGLLKVEGEATLQNMGLDFDGAIARLQQGTQTSKLSAADQRVLYDDLVETQGVTNSSFRLDADNVEDAFAEMMAKLIRVGYDAGYYG